MKVLPPFNNSKLILRLKKCLVISNSRFHESCDNQGPLLILVSTKNKHRFGAYCHESWSSLGGWRKSRNSYLFSITDGLGREPFICRIRKDVPQASMRAIYFSDKFGLVFGTHDLTINFDNLKASSSELGNIFEPPVGVGPSGLAGSFSDWEINDIEIYKLMIN